MLEMIPRVGLSPPRTQQHPTPTPALPWLRARAPQGLGSGEGLSAFQPGDSTSLVPLGTCGWAQGT